MRDYNSLKGFGMMHSSRWWAKVSNMTKGAIAMSKKGSASGQRWARKQHPISVAETWCLFIKKETHQNLWYQNINCTICTASSSDFTTSWHHISWSWLPTRTTFGINDHHTCCHRPPRANALMAAFKITRPEIHGTKNDGRTSMCKMPGPKLSWIFLTSCLKV